MMKQSVQLDVIDCQILRILQAEGDISTAALSERVGASAASCWRRIKSLETTGVLRATVRLLDPAAIGCGLDVMCQVRMKSHHPDMRSEFERFVAEHEEIMECYSMSGEWDYQLRIIVSDVSSYEDFLMHKLLSHAAVAASTSHFALKRIKYTTAMPVWRSNSGRQTS
jgi:DNA-binding Lrp family transcriptional regulator